MEVWRKGHEFVGMLERKQLTLQRNIVETENQLMQVKLQIQLHQQECTDINQQIKMLTPAGVLSRADIYKGIRQQGALMMHLQYVSQKISQLESEQHKLEQLNLQQRRVMTQLDKKHYKLNHYLQPLRRDYIRRCDNSAENEIQELAVYGRKST
ncbi:type III secretion system protein [Leclercia adecarboxylata]|nr:type III secretion system protein [Leclercia adecarboxylata]KMN64116.1 type III secretion system protein [Leclercia sp. LK8]